MECSDCRHNNKGHNCFPAAKGTRCRGATEQLQTELAGVKKRIIRAASYTGFEGYACPLCVYNDGVFIRFCASHARIDRQAKRIKQLRKALGTLLHRLDNQQTIMPAEHEKANEVYLQALKEEPKITTYDNKGNII